MSNKASRKRKVSICSLILLTPVLLFAQAEFGINALWETQKRNAYRDALEAGLGFSLIYDGKRIGPAVSPDWRIERGTGASETVFRHSSGLTVIRTSRRFTSSDAVEFSLSFRNDSAAVLPAISDINSLDLTVAGDIIQGTSVVSSGGGTAESVYPPANYALKRTYFGPLTPTDGQVYLGTSPANISGKPSLDNLPFFFVENETSAQGIFIGVGWSGEWGASVRINHRTRTLRITAGIKGVNLRLQPHEEIPGPVLLLGAYSGPLSNGSNALRRLVRDRYLTQPDVARIKPPVLYTTWFDIGAELDEKMFRALVDQAAETGHEIFLLDAGWYNGTPYAPIADMQRTWLAISHSLGNWDQGEDRTRFPSGLRALADYVRSKGMQFGLWFEPERAGPKSLLAAQHPELLVYVPGRLWGMVDFGQAAVQDYFIRTLDRYIRDLGIRYIRWDQNNEHKLYWEAHDSSDRRGITQIRHLQGIHRVEDWLRQNHPEVILESCAGGGNRVELTTLARRQTFFASDQTMDPLIVRFHLDSINLFLPGAASLVSFTPPLATYTQPGFEFRDIAFQSYFGGAFGSSGRLDLWTPELKRQMKKHVAEYKKIRDYLWDDYYLLLQQPKTLDSWAGWQFHDPQSDSGFLQVFRLRSPADTTKVVLKGLNDRATYELTDPYTGQKSEKSGAILTTEGLSVRLPELSSQILRYRRR